MEHTKKMIYVGLSGGVDSSVAALRLKRAGHNVTGVFIKVWQPDFIECDWERERLDAMRVAAHLGIPFLTFDAEEVYKREVADYMVREYAAGRTPNPDVMCNRHIKFGAFLQFAREAGADAIATGHYARRGAKMSLLRGVDHKKDQSYFLWTLTKTELLHTYFPVGDSTKDNIRVEAANARLPTAAKKDSQGICFLGSVDIETFLMHFVTLVPGDVLDPKGNTIGRHKGALVYTIGQRHGFMINEASSARMPHYVVAKDVDANTITVDCERPRTPSGTVVLTSVNQIEPWDQKSTYTLQLRYRQIPFPATLTSAEDGRAILSIPTSSERPVPGQSCVLYQDERCVGGGIVT